MVCDEDRIDHLVNFYSKSNRLSISIFTVIVIDLVAMPRVVVVKLQRNLNLCCSHHSSRGKGAGFSQA